MNLQSHQLFEGSYGGVGARIADDARLECKICWTVYDPAAGCETWQIAKGTPFSALPEHWRCPNCDAPKSGFMVIDGGAMLPAPVLRPAEPLERVEEAAKAAKAIGDALERAFTDLHHGRMRDVPILNKALTVQAIGFQPRSHATWGECTLGILLTPWFMNIVLVPAILPEAVPMVGAKTLVDFPSGRYEFVWAEREEVGPYMAASLFSPVYDFATQLAAVDVARAALVGLFDEAHREEGTRSGEIRALREKELAEQTAREEAAALAALETEKPLGEVEPLASRRALLTGKLVTPKEPMAEGEA